MKRHILAAFALLIALSSPAAGLTIPTEQISGSLRSGMYSWRYSYDLSVINDAIHVDIDYAFMGPMSDTLWNRWETGIESIWSTNRFSIPILFNVDRVSDTTSYDYLVKVQAGSGRADLAHWYAIDPFSQRTAAHEAGHFWGLFDQYATGAIDPETHRITNGLMGSLFGETLSEYYDPFLDWYEDKLEMYGGGDETAPVPEPSTIALWLVGLLGVVVVKKRQTI